jgi:hypothetical protein
MCLSTLFLFRNTAAMPTRYMESKVAFWELYCAEATDRDQIGPTGPGQGTGIEHEAALEHENHDEHVFVCAFYITQSTL